MEEFLRKFGEDLNDTLLRELWTKRNPVHDLNADTGQDMYDGTVVCVLVDYIRIINSARGD